MNGTELKVEVVLSDDEKVGVSDGSSSEIGSSAGRLGVGSTGGGRGRSVASPVAVVIPGGEEVSVRLKLGTQGVEGDGGTIIEPEGGGEMMVEPEGVGRTIVEPPEVRVEPAETEGGIKIVVGLGWVLLEAEREAEVDRVVSVDDKVPDAWLEVVVERPELELCPGGTTTVVDDDPEVELGEV